MKYGYLISRTQAPLEWTLHPWIHSNCNSLTDEDQLRVVQFPDLHPGRSVSSAEILTESQLSCSLIHLKKNQMKMEQPSEESANLNVDKEHLLTSIGHHHSQVMHVI
jgi:hypothetical protein